MTITTSIIFLATSVVSLVLIYFAINFRKKITQKKKLGVYLINRDATNILFPKSGSYTLSLTDKCKMQDFTLKLRSQENQSVTIHEQFLKYTTFATTDCYKINIEKPGNYALSLDPKGSISTEATIGVKEYSSPKNFLISLICGIFGIQLLLGSISYLLYLLKIIVPTR